MDEVSMIKARWRTNVKLNALRDAVGLFIDCHDHLDSSCDCEQNDKLDDLVMAEDLITERFLELDHHMLNGGIWPKPYSNSTAGQESYSRINTFILLHVTAHNNEDHETALGADAETSYAIVELLIQLDQNNLPEGWKHEV